MSGDETLVRIGPWFFTYIRLESRMERTETGLRFMNRSKTYDSRTHALIRETDWMPGAEMTYSSA